MRMRHRLIWFLAVFITAAVSSMAAAGEFYISDDKSYWWYWDDAPRYELLIPSNCDSYAPSVIFDERTLDLTLKKDGPILRISGVSNFSGSYESLKEALLIRWRHVLSGLKINMEREYTSERNLKFRFIEITGKTPTGKTGMIRYVVYIKGRDVVTIQLFCEEKEYAGVIKDQWMKAIHSFNWRG
ncbi:MAG TPA: hypothetical protein GXX29_04630 [Firmicutes bacterium]|nr:hypothetical protein [Bacillota bacterium]